TLARRRNTIVIAALASVGPACTTVHTDPPNLRGQDVRLTIVHTADLHSRLLPYQFAPGAIDKGLGLVPTNGNIAVVGGIARVASIIKCIREGGPLCDQP